jgi:hypothetical protein
VLRLRSLAAILICLSSSACNSDLNRALVRNDQCTGGPVFSHVVNGAPVISIPADPDDQFFGPFQYPRVTPGGGDGAVYSCRANAFGVYVPAGWTADWFGAWTVCHPKCKGRFPRGSPYGTLISSTLVVGRTYRLVAYNAPDGPMFGHSSAVAQRFRGESMLKFAEPFTYDEEPSGDEFVVFVLIHRTPSNDVIGIIDSFSYFEKAALAAVVLLDIVTIAAWLEWFRLGTRPRRGKKTSLQLIAVGIAVALTVLLFAAETYVQARETTDLLRYHRSPMPFLISATTQGSLFAFLATAIAYSWRATRGMRWRAIRVPLLVVAVFLAGAHARDYLGDVFWVYFHCGWPGGWGCK